MAQMYYQLPREKLASFCKKYHIEKMSVFGSVLTPDFRPSSDIDFLVEFDKQNTPSLFEIVNMEEELSSIVGRHADLRTAEDLSRFFRDEVVKQALQIYANS